MIGLPSRPSRASTFRLYARLCTAAIYLANSDEPMSENLLTTDHEQTELPENADRSADRAVQDMLEKAREKEPTHGRRKYTTTFTAEDRAKVGKYAAENGIVKAQRHFKELKLSKSTVRYFRKRYLNG